MAGACNCSNEHSGSIKFGEFLGGPLSFTGRIWSMELVGWLASNPRQRYENRTYSAQRKMQNSYRILVGKPEGKSVTGTATVDRRMPLKWDPNKTKYMSLHWTHLALDTVQ